MQVRSRGPEPDAPRPQRLPQLVTVGSQARTDLPSFLSDAGCLAGAVPEWLMAPVGNLRLPSPFPRPPAGLSPQAGRASVKGAAGGGGRRAQGSLPLNVAARLVRFLWTLPTPRPSSGREIVLKVFVVVLSSKTLAAFLFIVPQKRKSGF